jgi:hypothetical protein
MYSVSGELVAFRNPEIGQVNTYAHFVLRTLLVVFSDESILRVKDLPVVINLEVSSKIEN